LKDRLTTLEKEKEAASAKLAAVRPEPVLRLHPGLPALYKKRLKTWLPRLTSQVPQRMPAKL
jgi:hypothetical protein